MKNIVFSFIFLLCQPLFAEIWSPQGDLLELQAITDSVRAGDVVVLGEEHGTAYQPPQHLAVIEALKAKGLTVDLGMEFISFPDQETVQNWKAGSLTEREFLKLIGWGGFSFDSYRQQMLAARHVWAINAPKALTSQIGKVGIGGLTDEQKALLPPDFILGNDLYRQRFQEVIHVTDPEKLQRYFEAQSTWDDTMAYQTCLRHQADPEAVIVIIVGEFHVQYGGGLPDRLKARNCAPVKSISFVQLEGSAKPSTEVLTHPQYGERADFIWTSFF